MQMNAIFLCVIAAVFAAIANFFFKKGADRSATESFNFYLLFYFLTSFLFSFALTSFSDETGPFNLILFAVGCTVGALNMWMLRLTCLALQRGPAGLTFAFQSASGIFPGILLFVLFGPLFGFDISLSQIAGMLLVIYGLFIGSNQSRQKATFAKTWVFYAIGCFLVQVLALSLIHWRCLLFQSDHPPHALIPWTIDSCSDQWFLPGQFGTAFILQLILTIRSERLVKNTYPMICGSLGGITNVITSVLLLLATKVSLPLEKGLIFPTYTAATILFCNAWAMWIYQERFHWRANIYSFLGIFIATVL